MVWWNIVTLTCSANAGIFALQCATIHDERRNVTKFHHVWCTLKLRLKSPLEIWFHSIIRKGTCVATLARRTCVVRSVKKRQYKWSSTIGWTNKFDHINISCPLFRNFIDGDTSHPRSALLVNGLVAEIKHAMVSQTIPSTSPNVLHVFR